MNNIPIDYARSMAMEYYSLQPNPVKGMANIESAVQRRYLYTKLYSAYKFTIPKEWPLNFFRPFLFLQGTIAAIYTQDRGWIVYPYGVTGLDMYYQPREIVVYNRMLDRERYGLIGVNSEIIRILDDYGGIDDIVRKYAYQLASIDKSLDINLMNANVALIVEAENKKDADTIKEAYNKASTGEPMVSINKRLIEGQQLRTLISSPKSNYMGLELMQTRQEIIRQFCTDVGIPSANYNKRAQMSPEEITHSNGETKSLCTVIRDTIQECFDKLNKISGLGCKVELNTDITEGGASYAATDIIRDGQLS